MASAEKKVSANLLQKITLISLLEFSNHIISSLKFQGSDFTNLNQADLQKIWKALFYAMWHSDKYYNQQLLASEIAQLSRLYYNKFNSFLLYLRSLLFVLQKEWDKIDYWRTNKFLMMFRCILEEIIILIKHFNWKDNYIRQINDVFSTTILQNTDAGVDGLQLHFIQIFIECLINENTSSSITDESIALFLDPFFQLLKTSPNSLLREKIVNYIYEKIQKCSPDQLKQFKKELYAFNVLEIAQNDLYQIDFIINYFLRTINPQNRKTLYKVAQILQPLTHQVENENENGENQESQKENEEKENQEVEFDQDEQQQVEQIIPKKKKKEKRISNELNENTLQERTLPLKKRKKQVDQIKDDGNDDEEILKVPIQKNNLISHLVKNIEEEKSLSNGEVNQEIPQKKKKKQNQEAISNGDIKQKKQEKLLKKQEEIVANNLNYNTQTDELIEGLDYSEVRKSKQKMDFLKQIMNSIPPFLFMSPQEKRKFFSDVSKRFMENITKESGSKCPHQKKVKFGSDLQVQEFRQADPVQHLQQKLKKKTKKLNL